MRVSINVVKGHESAVIGKISKAGIAWMIPRLKYTIQSLNTKFVF